MKAILKNKIVRFFIAILVVWFLLILRNLEYKTIYMKMAASWYEKTDEMPIELKKITPFDWQKGCVFDSMEYMPESEVDAAISRAFGREFISPLSGWSHYGKDAYLRGFAVFKNADQNIVVNLIPDLFSIYGSYKNEDYTSIYCFTSENAWIYKPKNNAYTYVFVKNDEHEIHDFDHFSDPEYRKAKIKN